MGAVILQASDGVTVAFWRQPLVVAGALIFVLLVVVAVFVLLRRRPADGESEAPEPEDDAGESTGSPRRAVSVPAYEERRRPSEQTLKRAELPPRASEVDGNPGLPDGTVKIRCVACDRKMKAPGPKFARQRRCPNCKATPFRFRLDAS